jgi:hypothetical protein
MEIVRPKIKNFSSESYELLLAYAVACSSALDTVVDEAKALGATKSQLKDSERYRRARATAEFAWRDTHEMAITVSKIYAELGNEVVNRLLSLPG